MIVWVLRRSMPLPTMRISRGLHNSRLRFGLAAVVSEDIAIIPYWSHDLSSVQECLALDTSIAVVQDPHVLPWLWKHVVALQPVIGWNILGFD